MSDPSANRIFTNADSGELARFDALAQRWWDADGPSRPLHDLNPVRLEYIAARIALAGAEVLDAGCGGGLLSEALARAGARVTGIDLAPQLLEVARLHLLESGLQVGYRECSAEVLAEEYPGRFDAVACMELIEHVPRPDYLIAACARLLKPGGRLFVSTLNRTPRAFATAIFGAEYVLQLLPRGTHRYAQFIRPSELASWLRAADCEVEDISGLGYNPFSRRAWLTRDPAVNYLVSAVKP